MKRILCLTFIVFVISGCSNSSDHDKLAADAIILAFGDSLTYGSGAGGQANSYPSQLQNLIHRQVINAGIPGSESSDGLKRLPKLLNDYHPSLILICYGGNDMLRKREREKTKANLKAMIELAWQNEISVVLIGVPEPKVHFSVAPLYIELAKNMSVPANLNSLSNLLKQRKFRADPIHLNSAGYEALAQALEKTLEKYGFID